MNHFDAADFSECHSEEVISFFWRSVYITISVKPDHADDKSALLWQKEARDIPSKSELLMFSYFT